MPAAGASGRPAAVAQLLGHGGAAGKHQHHIRSFVCAALQGCEQQWSMTEQEAASLGARSFKDSHRVLFVVTCLYCLYEECTEEHG